MARRETVRAYRPRATGSGPQARKSVEWQSASGAWSEGLGGGPQSETGLPSAAELALSVARASQARQSERRSIVSAGDEPRDRHKGSVVPTDGPRRAPPASHTFRLAVFVSRVRGLTIPIPARPAVVLRLLNFPALVVRRDRDDSAVGAGDLPHGFSVNRGKACVFESPPGAFLAAASHSLPVTVMLVCGIPHDGTTRLAGTAAMDLAEVATKACTSGRRVSGEYSLSLVDMAGRYVGTIDLECRLSVVGSPKHTLAAPSAVRVSRDAAADSGASPPRTPRAPEGDTTALSPEAERPLRPGASLRRSPTSTVSPNAPAPAVDSASDDLVGAAYLPPPLFFKKTTAPRSHAARRSHAAAVAQRADRDRDQASAGAQQAPPAVPSGMMDTLLQVLNPATTYSLTQERRDAAEAGRRQAAAYEAARRAEASESTVPPAPVPRSACQGGCTAAAPSAAPSTGLLDQLIRELVALRVGAVSGTAPATVPSPVQPLMVTDGDAEAAEPTLAAHGLSDSELARLPGNPARPEGGEAQAPRRHQRPPPPSPSPPRRRAPRPEARPPPRPPRERGPKVVQVHVRRDGTTQSREGVVLPVAQQALRLANGRRSNSGYAPLKRNLHTEALRESRDAPPAPPQAPPRTTTADSEASVSTSTDWPVLPPAAYPVLPGDHAAADEAQAGRSAPGFIDADAYRPRHARARSTDGGGAKGVHAGSGPPRRRRAATTAAAPRHEEDIRRRWLMSRGRRTRDSDDTFTLRVSQASGSRRDRQLAAMWQGRISMERISTWSSSLGRNRYDDSGLQASDREGGLTPYGSEPPLEAQPMRGDGGVPAGADPYGDEEPSVDGLFAPEPRPPPPRSRSGRWGVTDRSGEDEEPSVDFLFDDPSGGGGGGDGGRQRSDALALFGDAREAEAEAARVPATEDPTTVGLLAPGEAVEGRGVETARRPGEHAPWPMPPADPDDGAGTGGADGSDGGEYSADEFEPETAGPGAQARERGHGGSAAAAAGAAESDDDGEYTEDEFEPEAESPRRPAPGTGRLGVGQSSTSASDGGDGDYTEDEFDPEPSTVDA